jgi:hypothetical protein
LCSALLVGVGCGSDHTFTADEFADEVNAEGVEMRLGRQLHSGEGKDLYEMTLPALPGTPPPAPGTEGERGGSGTLYVFDDVDGAEEELAACRNSGGLVCYRASNVVVLFEEGGIEAQRLGVAIQRLAEE